MTSPIKKLSLLFFAFIAFQLIGCEKDSSTQQEPIVEEEEFDLDENLLIAQGYTKVFGDDFSSDFSLWNVWTGGAYNNELQYYQQANMELANGILKIHAKKQTVVGNTLPGSGDNSTFGYTSGRIESKFEVAPTPSAKKVRMSARIRLPEGYGMWPAFWSYGNPWPTKGEIDILEGTGPDMTKYITNYFYGPTAGTAVTNDAFTVDVVSAGVDLSKAFHVYELIWSQNSLIFLLDGRQVATKIASEEGNGYIPMLFGKPQNVILNLAVGGGIFGPSFDATKVETGTMQVDWVKVFVAN